MTSYPKTVSADNDNVPCTLTIRVQDMYERLGGRALFCMCTGKEPISILDTYMHGA